MAYYVSTANTTPDEPSLGWYYSTTDENEREIIVGPFYSREAALDDESGGEYSAYLESKRDDHRPAEELDQELIDSGRGHLIRR